MRGQEWHITHESDAQVLHDHAIQAEHHIIAAIDGGDDVMRPDVDEEFKREVTKEFNASRAMRRKAGHKRNWPRENIFAIYDASGAKIATIRRSVSHVLMPEDIPHGAVECRLVGTMQRHPTKGWRRV